MNNNINQTNTRKPEKDDTSFLNSFFGATSITSSTTTDKHEEINSNNKIRQSNIDIDYINKSLEDSNKKNFNVNNIKEKTIFDGIKNNNMINPNIQKDKNYFNSKGNVLDNFNFEGFSSTTANTTNNNPMQLKKNSPRNSIQDFDFNLTTKNAKKDMNVLDSLLTDLPSNNNLNNANNWDMNFNYSNNIQSNFSNNSIKKNSFGNINTNNFGNIDTNINPMMSNLNNQQNNDFYNLDFLKNNSKPNQNDNNVNSNYNFSFDPSKLNNNNRNELFNGLNVNSSQKNTGNKTTSQNILDGLLNMK